MSTRNELLESIDARVGGGTKTILTDNLGNDAEVGLFGGLKVSSPAAQISATFDRPLPPDLFITTGTPEGQFNRSLLRVKNGDSVQTRDVLRYRTAQTIEVYFTAAFIGDFSAGTTEETYICLFDDQDGPLLGFKGSDFVVGYRNTGAGADVLQVVTPPADITKIHRYRVRFGYLGVGDMAFEYKVTGQEWALLHLFGTDGTLSGRTHVGSPILPMRANCNHAGCEILSGSWNAQTYGSTANLQEFPFALQGERTVAGSATPQMIFALRNKTTLGAYDNKVRSKLTGAEFATSSEGLYRIEVYQYPEGTLDPLGTWTAADSGTVLEINDTLTDAVGAGRLKASFMVAVPSQGTGTGSAALDFVRQRIQLAPGEELAFFKREIVSGGGTDATAWAVTFVDLF